MAISVQWLALRHSSLGTHADQHSIHSSLGFLWTPLVVPGMFLGLGWRGKGEKKPSLFPSSILTVFFQLTSPNPPSLTTLAVFLLGENLGATLTCFFPLTFAQLILPGHKCLYLVPYFLPVMQISCHKKECSGSVCLGEAYSGFVPEIVVWELYFSVSSCVCRAPTKGLSEIEIILW